MKIPYVLALLVLVFMSGLFISDIGETRAPFVVSWMMVFNMWAWSAGFFILGLMAGKDKE
jgi:hypothetical protein